MAHWEYCLGAAVWVLSYYMTKARLLMANLSLRSFSHSKPNPKGQDPRSNIQRRSKLQFSRAANKRRPRSALRRLHQPKRTVRPTLFSPGAWIFPGSWILDLGASLPRLALGIWIFSGAWCLALGASPVPLTTAQQVLDLGLESARRAVIPVRLQGLVTYPDAGGGVIYVQDSSAGIRVAYTNANYQPASGQMVVVEGSAAGGVFAPFVDCANVRVIGSSAIPEPCEAPAGRMAAGELFGQWVQVERVVRDLAKEPDRVILFVSSGGLRFHSVIQPFSGSALPLEWLDARVG